MLDGKKETKDEGSGDTAYLNPEQCKQTTSYRSHSEGQINPPDRFTECTSGIYIIGNFTHLWASLVLPVETMPT